MRQAEQNDNDDLAQKLMRQIRDLIKSMPTGIAIVDLDGVIEGVNPAIETLFGYQGRELAGRDIAILFRCVPWSGSTIMDWFLANENHVVELEGLSKDEEIVPIEL